MKRAALLVALALPAAGCATTGGPAPGTAPAPSTPWRAPAGVAAAPAAAPAGEAPLPAGPRSLAELVDLGLRRHPDTRLAWLAARASEASLQAERSAWYPQVEAGADVGRSRSGFGTGPLERTSGGPFVSVSWLLFDFGGRSAAVEQARQALIAADWTHNAALADRVLEITTAYRRHQAAVALAAAQRSVVAQAQANLDAAEARRNAGVATIAEVLQTRTALSRAQLALQSDDGAVVTTRADLGFAVGLPAAAPLEVEPLPAELAVEEIGRDVEAVLREAARERPEVAAAEAEVRRAEARVAAVRAAARPRLVSGATFGRTYVSEPSQHANTYSAQLAFSVPVFTGFAQRANTLRAEAELEASRARAELLRRQIEVEVVKAYQGVLTAGQQVRTGADLVASAEKNHEVALGRYRAGAGSILEVLTAQSALEDARAQDVRARADWLAALAALARANGQTLSGMMRGTER